LVTYQHDCRECGGYGCDDCEPEPDQPQESDDVRAEVPRSKRAIHVPTLKEIRQHIKKHAWNGTDFTSRDSNSTVFLGQCEYASTAISEMLTGTGKNTKGGNDWSLRKRGWYSGDLSGIMTRSSCDPHARSHSKHCHSWVEYKGLLIDPTWWAFADDSVRVYVFEVGDPRYTYDDGADHGFHCGTAIVDGKVIGDKCTLCGK
jgi:hypothetical protein